MSTCTLRNRARDRGKLDGDYEPVVAVKFGKDNVYGFEVDMLDGCRVVYSPTKPLSCGARLWIETTGRVLVDGKEVNNKYKKVTS